MCGDLLHGNCSLYGDDLEEGQADLCDMCQVGCKWREVAVRYLLSKRPLNSVDGNNDEFVAEQKEVDKEARRLYVELNGVLPGSLPKPPVGRHGAMVGRIPRS